MMQLRRNKLVQTVVWLAFFAFGMHSFFVCHCHQEHFSPCVSAVHHFTLPLSDNLFHPKFVSSVLDKSSQSEEHHDDCKLVYSQTNKTQSYLVHSLERISLAFVLELKKSIGCFVSIEQIYFCPIIYLVYQFLLI